MPCRQVSDPTRSLIWHKKAILGGWNVLGGAGGCSSLKHLSSEVL